MMLKRILDKQLELNDEGNPAWGSSGEYKSQESKDIDNFVDFASELAELKAKQDELKEKQLEQMREEYHPKYLEYVGKFFKMENAYSGDRKWSEYLKVVDAPKDFIYESAVGVNTQLVCKRFAQDAYGEIRIDMNFEIFLHNIGKEITESKYNKEVDKILKQIEK